MGRGLSPASLPPGRRCQPCRRSPAAEGAGQDRAGPGPLPSLVGSPLASLAGCGARHWVREPCPGRAGAGPGLPAGAGSWHRAQAERRLSPRIHAPWSKPAWQARRAFWGSGSGCLSPLIAFLLLDGWVLLEEPVWSLQPVPNLQGKSALGPIVSLHPHPVTSSPACRLPRGAQGRGAHRASLPVPQARPEAPAGRRGQSRALGCQLPPWESGLGAGSLSWCKSGQDPASSADSPLGNGCHSHLSRFLASMLPLSSRTHPWLPALRDPVSWGM